MEKFFADIEKQIAKATERMNNESGFVVANADYVRVPKDKSFNGTGFISVSIYSANDAIIYATENDAYRYGQDFYLRNGKNEEIILNEIPAREFFEGVIAKTRETLKMMRELLANQNK